MPSEVVGWRLFVLSWLNQLLAKQHAANAASPVEQPAGFVSEASQLKPLSTSTNGGPGGQQSSTASGSGWCNSSLAGQKGTIVLQEEQHHAALECPEELYAVRDFVWGLFDRFIDPLLDWVVESQATALPVVAVAQLAAVTTLFETQAANLR